MKTNIAIALLLTACTPLKQQQIDPVVIGRSVVQIQAVAPHGKHNMGSGVVIAANAVATNCHVTRAAKRIYVIKEDRQYAVLAQAKKPEQDVCVLQTESLDLPIAKLARTAPGVADTINQYGYPFGLNLRMMPGAIIALHAFGSDQIIEINSGFNFGASGGGVFNSQGELIGLMTFMGKAVDGAHFYVIPAQWLDFSPAFAPLQAFSNKSFWEIGAFNQLKH